MIAKLYLQLGNELYKNLKLKHKSNEVKFHQGNKYDLLLQFKVPIVNMLTLFQITTIYTNPVTKTLNFSCKRAKKQKFVKSTTL